MTLPKIHDRKAKEINRQAEVAPIEVDDPHGLDPGDKIVVLRQLRSDPLARLHAHRQINDAQYHAGRAYQRDWETAERGPQAIDPTKEAVDGGQFPEALTDGQRKARKRLVQMQAALGRKMYKLAHAVLIDGQHVEHFAKRSGAMGESWMLYYGRLFRDALDTLAVEYQLAVGR